MNSIIIEYWRLDRRYHFVRNIDGAPFLAVVDDFGNLVEADFDIAANYD